MPLSLVLDVISNNFQKKKGYLFYKANENEKKILITGLVSTWPFYGLITKSTIIILRCCKILLKLHILTSQMTAPSGVSTKHLTS